MATSPIYKPVNPSCPLPDSCGIPGLLKNARHELQNDTINELQDTINLRQIKAVDNLGQVTFGYPLNDLDISKIATSNLRATLISAKYKDKGGEEEIQIAGYDPLKGQLKIYRNLLSPAKFHTATNSQPILINFGIISVDLINNLRAGICAVTNALCATFPSPATTSTPGIGKASSIATQNIGQVPTFITTDDANWQAITASIGGSNSNSALAKLASFIAQNTACNTDDSSKTNFDLLQSTINSLCDQEKNFDDIIKALGGGLIPVVSGSATVGVQFKGRVVSSDYGFKFNILHQAKRVGSYNPTQPTSYISTTQSTTGQALSEDFTGRGSATGYIGTQIYDQVNVQIPARGRLKFNGSITSGWSDGLTLGQIVIKQGSVILETLNTIIVDTKGQNRGSSYGQDQAIIITSPIHEFSNYINPGGYSITFQTLFTLPPSISSSNKAGIYRFSHDVEFIPDL